MLTRCEQEIVKPSVMFMSCGENVRRKTVLDDGAQPLCFFSEVSNDSVLESCHERANEKQKDALESARHTFEGTTQLKIQRGEELQSRTKDGTVLRWVLACAGPATWRSAHDHRSHRVGQLRPRSASKLSDPQQQMRGSLRKPVLHVGATKYLSVPFHHSGPA